MAKDIEVDCADFRHDERDAVAFPATVDGRPLTCLVTAEVLIRWFRARSNQVSEVEPAFARGQDDIEAVARKLIEAGQINAKNEVWITMATWR
jgi:hypothetical protein